ncbi:MAG: HAD family hydrolase [Promethearchaeota archaeon]|nr:MAG: HAD family hydrolase [Candidatus Lokiarchaeota archaeon]
MMVKKLLLGLDGDGIIFNSLNQHFEHMKQVCYSLDVDFVFALERFLWRNNKTSLEFGSLIEAYKYLLNTPGHYSHFYINLGVDYWGNESFINNTFKDFLNSDSIRVFDGIALLISDLREQGIKVCLFTSNYRDNVTKILDKNSIVLDYVVSSDDVKNPKPHPEGLNKCLDEFNVRPEQAVYVGDMILDAQASCAAGVDFIGVTYGYTGNGVLDNYPNIGVADSVESLKKVLLRLF